jgi:hypothetical protein
VNVEALFDHDRGDLVQTNIELLTEKQTCKNCGEIVPFRDSDLRYSVGRFLAGFVLGASDAGPADEEGRDAGDYQVALLNDEDFWRGFLEARADISVFNEKGISDSPAKEPSFKLKARPEILHAFLTHVFELDAGDANDVNAIYRGLCFEEEEKTRARIMADEGLIKARGPLAKKIVRFAFGGDWTENADFRQDWNLRHESIVRDEIVYWTKHTVRATDKYRRRVIREADEEVKRHVEEEARLFAKAT